MSLKAHSREPQGERDLSQWLRAAWYQPWVRSVMAHSRTRAPGEKQPCECCMQFILLSFKYIDGVWCDAMLCYAYAGFYMNARMQCVEQMTKEKTGKRNQCKQSKERLSWRRKRKQESTIALLKKIALSTRVVPHLQPYVNLLVLNISFPCLRPTPRQGNWHTALAASAWACPVYRGIWIYMACSRCWACGLSWSPRRGRSRRTPRGRGMG